MFFGIPHNFCQNLLSVQKMHEAYIPDCNTDFQSSESDAADLRRLFRLKFRLSKNMCGILLWRQNPRYEKCLREIENLIMIYVFLHL